MPRPRAGARTPRRSSAWDPAPAARCRRARPSGSGDRRPVHAPARAAPARCRCRRRLRPREPRERRSRLFRFRRRASALRAAGRAVRRAARESAPAARRGARTRRPPRRRRRSLLVRPCRDLVARAPELGIEVLLDQASEQLDGRSLRADDLVADDPRDDLVVAEAPDRHPLVPFGQGLGELVEVLELPAAHVELDDREPRLAPEGVEGLAELRRDAADGTEAGRVEPASVPEHLADRLVFPRRHLLEHVELGGDELKAEARAAKQPQRGRDLLRPHVGRRRLDLGRRELQPQLGRLVHGLEEELVVVHLLLGRLLERVRRGATELEADLSEELVTSIAARAGGDARTALNVLELAWQTAQSEGEELAERHVEDAARKRPLVYDKGADAHYDFTSAFIKSMRGSDPDAAVYYLAAMIESGEDPRFIARRMVVLASEDVGNADPRALLVAVAAPQPSRRRGGRGRATPPRRARRRTRPAGTRTRRRRAAARRRHGGRRRAA